MALLEVENLQTHFRTPDGVNRAVDGVSFEVAEGETLAVVGESGCGKSVTANSILRLVPEPPGKIAGSIRFQGIDLLKLDEAAMRDIRGARLKGALQSLRASGRARGKRKQAPRPMRCRPRPGSGNCPQACGKSDVPGAKMQAGAGPPRARWRTKLYAACYFCNREARPPGGMGCGLSPASRIAR